MFTWKADIKFRTDEAANNFVLSNDTTNTVNNAHIPLYSTKRKGVIKGVNTEFDTQDLIDLSNCSVLITHARSISRKNKNSITGLVEWIPSETVVLTFEGTTLLDYIKTYFKCLRYGHTTKLCRSHERCRTCGQDDHNRESCPPTESPKFPHEYKRSFSYKLQKFLFLRNQTTHYLTRKNVT